MALTMPMEPLLGAYSQEAREQASFTPPSPKYRGIRKRYAQKGCGKCKLSRLQWTTSFAHGTSVSLPSLILLRRVFRSQGFVIPLDGKMGILGTYALVQDFRRSEELCSFIVQ